MASYSSSNPDFDPSAPHSGHFSGVEDAMSSLGEDLRSPAFDQVDEFQSTATELNVTSHLDLNDLTAVHGATAAGEMWSTLQEVQSLSDAFYDCGNFVEEALLSATQDYIKNTGIQEAGRELQGKLGYDKDDVDCLAGFATLLDSAGIMNDALGLGDLSQIQSRLGSVKNDAYDASKLANIIINLDVIQSLLSPFDNMCSGVKDDFTTLIDQDVATIAAVLNKLSQWAAFAKLANSDPCALVNNNLMLSHITEPVMDDIVKLFNIAIGGTAAADELTYEILDSGGVAKLPVYTQAPGAGLQTFASKISQISGTQQALLSGLPFNKLSSLSSVGESVSNLAKSKATVESAAVSNGFDLTALVDYDLENTTCSCVGATKSMASLSRGDTKSAQCANAGGTWKCVDSTQKTEMNVDTQEGILPSSAAVLPKGATSAAGSPLAGLVSAVAAGAAAGSKEVTASKYVKTIVTTVAKKLAGQEGTLDPPISGSGSDEAKNPVVKGTKKKQTIHASSNASYSFATLFKAALQPTPSEGFKQATDAGDTWTEQLKDALAPLLDDQPWPTDMISAYESQNSGTYFKCSCIGATKSMASLSRGDTKSSQCTNAGGEWRCVETAVAKTVSGDTYNHKKNVELSTTLTSKGAFDVSKITG